MNILILELIIPLTSVSLQIIVITYSLIVLTSLNWLHKDLINFFLSFPKFTFEPGSLMQPRVPWACSQAWSATPDFPATISQVDYRCVPSHPFYTILGDWTQHCSLVKSTTWGIPPASLFCSSMPEFGEFIIHLDGWHLYLNFPDTNYQSHEHCTYPNSTTLITDFSKGINQDCPGEPMRN